MLGNSYGATRTTTGTYEDYIPATDATELRVYGQDGFTGTSTISG